MYITNKMEELSYAYIHAVASRAGILVTRRHPDLESGEIELKCLSNPAPDSLYAPLIEILLKSTAVDLGDAEAFSYALKMKNYRELRKPRHLPSLLVVFIMPAAEADWLVHDEASLVSRRCAYWHN